MAKTQAQHDLYRYLETRPHPWRQQFYLRGRNMTVGQLVATMRANKLSLEEAAADLDMPLAQIQEALSYYQVNQDMVDDELREEKRYLHVS